MFPLSYEIAAEVRDLKPLGGLFRLEGDEFERAYRAHLDRVVSTGSSGVSLRSRRRIRSRWCCFALRGRTALPSVRVRPLVARADRPAHRGGHAMYAIVIKWVGGTIELNGPYATEEQARAGVDRLVEKLDEDMAPVSAVHRFESGAVRVEYGREEFMEAYVREMCEPLVGEEATR
jgi:hypothetical protein